MAASELLKKCSMEKKMKEEQQTVTEEEKRSNGYLKEDGKEHEQCINRWEEVLLSFDFMVRGGNGTGYDML